MIEKKNKPAAKILLVTPVWRDSERLDAFGTELACILAGVGRGVDSIHWIIADDGSEVEEQKKLRLLHSRLVQIFPNITIHFADAHRGKGAVVREAWAQASGAQWLAFVDADGSLSPSELMRLLGVALDTGQSVLAIRKKTGTTRVVESFPRAMAHRLFILAVKLLVGVHCEDPQCGAKVLLAEDYAKVAPSLKENGLAFDSEMLAALAGAGCTWKELPVTWIEKDGGKVRLIRDAWGMLAALWKIRLRQRKGEFSI